MKELRMDINMKYLFVFIIMLCLFIIMLCLISILFTIKGGKPTPLGVGWIA